MSCAIRRIGMGCTIASSVATAQTPVQHPAINVRPGGWVNTQIVLQPGDNFVVQAGGQIHCPQCPGAPSSTPRGQGNLYRLYAQVGSVQYDLTQTPIVRVSEGGALYATVGTIQPDQAQYWQGAYRVQITVYPRAAPPNVPNPIPTQNTFSAWLGGDCERLRTEGIRPSPLLNLPGGMSKICPIYMEDWTIQADPVVVCLPGATPGDNWVGHPSGIVVFGSGVVPTWHMSGYSSNWPEAQPRHTGHSVFPWNLYFSARPDATSASIPVEVYQGKTCGQPSGNVVRFSIDVTVNQIRTFVVSLPSVFWTGYQLAVAAHGAHANWPAITREGLVNTQAQAAATGLLDTQSTTAFVIAQLDRGQPSSAVAGLVSQVYDRFRDGLNRRCTCDGVTTNIATIFAAGYNLCLAEIATLNSLPPQSLREYLSLLRQSAQSSGLLPVQGIDEALGYVNQGRQSLELKDFMVGLKNQLWPYAQRNCSCE